MILRSLALLLLLYSLGYALFTVQLPGPADDRHTDAIVVLTGGAKRIERGLHLLERHRAGRMLISGVDPSVRSRELAAQYDAKQALFKCCIDLGRQSVDTRSNAQEVASWLQRRKFRSVRLVTTDWHMPRALFELSLQVGDRVDLVGDAVPSSPSFRHLFMEYNKYLLRRAAVVVGI